MKSEKAEDEKSRLILEKLKEDDDRTAAQKEMMFYLKQQEDCEKEITQRFQASQVQSEDRLHAAENELE